MKKITIKDIAKEAGTAVSTVSYALNGSDKVSTETRNKILQIAEKLNFSLNGAARDLKRSKTNLIGIFMTELIGPYYTDIISGVQEYAAEHGYSIIVGTDYEKNSTAIKFMTEGRVDGAIISAPSITNEQIKQISQKMPLVLLDRDMADTNISNICIDNKNGVEQILEHVYEKKCKSIVIILGKKSRDNQEREKCLKEKLKDYDFNKIEYYQGDFTEQSGYEISEKNIKKELLPDAIIAFNDEMAIGVIKNLKERKIKVPENIIVTGFDDIQLASYITPTLTTISYSRNKMGKVAAEELIKILKKEGSGNKKIVLNTTLITRKSSKK